MAQKVDSMESAGLKNSGQQMPVSVQKQGEEAGSGRFLIFDLAFCCFLSLLT